MLHFPPIPVLPYLLSGDPALTGAGVIGNGSTLPVATIAGQLFYHTPTGRKYLMQWDGSAWKPVRADGATTVYVDGTNGTDAQDNGHATGTSAYRTIQYALDQLPPVLAGNVTISIAAGTYAEALTVQGKFAAGAYTITLQGTLSTVETITAGTGSVAGTGATQGTVVCSNILAYYALANVNDSTPNALNLTNNNVVTFTATGAKVGTAADFEAGSSQYLSSNSASFNLTGDMTLSAWVKLESKPGDMGILDRFAGGTTGYSLFYDGGADRFCFIIGDGVNPTRAVRTGGPPTIGTWHYVVARRNQSEGKIYISMDGGASNSENTGSTGIANAAVDFTLGSGGGGASSFFDGMMDEASVDSADIGQVALVTRYNNGSGSAWPLAELWTTNEVQHTILRGTSGVNNGVSRLVDSNNTTTATIIGVWSGGAPARGDTFTVENWASGVKIQPASGHAVTIKNVGAKVILDRLYLDPQSASDSVWAEGASTWVAKRCRLTRGVTCYLQSKGTLGDFSTGEPCFLDGSAAFGFWQDRFLDVKARSEIEIQQSKLVCTATPAYGYVYGVYANNGSFAYIDNGTRITGQQTFGTSGINSEGVLCADCSTATVEGGGVANVRVDTWDRGVRAQNNSPVTTYSVTYSGNTTNESADAATFGAII